MQLNFDVLNRVSFLTGSAEIVCSLQHTPALEPFSDDMIEFLNDVSAELMKDKRCKAFPDVVTFGFWIRKASVLKMKDRFMGEGFRLGKGVAFHIAPSNVPVNFAYSLATGLLCGNANVVRVPGKDFEQVNLITEAFNKALELHSEMRAYVTLVRYERDRDVNDLFSALADVRIIWGGDETIAELRRSPLPPRSGEVTFADRYSLAVIDADVYLASENKKRIAEYFYNDTFLSDQNACTSPRVIIWTGGKKEEAKQAFWTAEHDLVKEKYRFQPIQGVNKLTKALVVAAKEENVTFREHEDNLIVRVEVEKLTDTLMDYRDNSGYFYEYDCDDVMDLVPLCNDKHCQTVAYIGSKKMLLPLLKAGVKGIDRIVPVGRTMDFELLWDGYDLTAMLTRTVVMR